MMKQITVVQRRMTAAMLQEGNTKLEAILHCLKVTQQTGWRQRRERVPKQAGQSGEEEPSAGRVALPSAWSHSGFHWARQRAPRPAVLVGCEQQNRGLSSGSLTPLSLKIPLQLLLIPTTE